MRRRLQRVFSIIFLSILLAYTPALDRFYGNVTDASDSCFSLPVNAADSSSIVAAIPAYSGSPSVTLNNNVPLFTPADMTTSPFESYTELDSLGRCGVCYANICQEIMPTEERGAIGSVKPSGWSQAKYPGVVDSEPPYLYNRCHLIGYQLSGENANVKNLITGTRYMNVEGMLPFENQVAEYVNRTNNHVLYRVTPIFQGNNLLASGVTIEAMSVEDNGAGLCFYVYVYNVQPSVEIDYATGDSKLSEFTRLTAVQTTSETPDRTLTDNTAASGNTQQSSNAAVTSAGNTVQTAEGNPDSCTYVLNKNTNVFHYPTCSSVKQMSEKNKIYFNGTRDEADGMGYRACQKCNP